MSSLPSTSLHQPLTCQSLQHTTISMRVMLPYWTNSGNRSWTVMPDDDCQSCNQNVANKVLLPTVTVQDLLPEHYHLLLYKLW